MNRKVIIPIVLLSAIILAYAFSVHRYVSNLVKGAPIGTGLAAKQLCENYL